MSLTLWSEPMAPRMSKDERIDLKYYENKYTFETPIDPNWNGAPWTTAELKVILDELKRCYEEIDALQGKIDDAHEVMEKYSNEEIDNVCDAYEEVCMALG